MEPAGEQKCCETKNRCCFRRKMPGVFIILAGVTLLLVNRDMLSEENGMLVFSIIVILFGVSKLCGGFCRCCDKS